MPDTPESIARRSIDRQLTEAGWTVQDRRSMDLSMPAVALCETDVQGGFADYMQFVDGKALGVVEAKAAGTPLVGVAEQSEGYARAKLTDFQQWANPLPFTYESNGEEWRFRDLRDPRSRSRDVFGPHEPGTLRDWVQQKDTLRSRLGKLPPLVRAGLRDCQVEAIAGLENSLSRNHPRALIQMATGAGKTFCAVTECYRLIKFAGARRILFLVDRGNLGRQAKREFDGWRSPYTQRLFTEEYIVQHLDGSAMEPRAKVVISTIQRLYSQLVGVPLDPEADERSTFDATGDTDGERVAIYNPALPPESFDLIFVDECHRSIYNEWKKVLDYFDSFFAGLTATPSAHTLAFFNQNLVATYPHERAVLEKVNVGYDIYRIRTKLGEKGATVSRGNHLEKIERKTRKRRWEKLRDDFTWQARELDRSVISKPQVRTVLTHFRDSLFTQLFPQRSGEWVPKTLIFAKDDAHADRIVDLVREVFAEGNEFCKKITYRAGGKKTTDDLIAEFCTSPALRVAVTVDMIATGTDIKPLEILLFLRDVRSALYYEQMKGRGTRTCEPHELRTVTPDAKAKTHFVLVDAVGVTQSPKSATNPLNREASVPFEKLLDKVARGNRTDATFSTLASRLLRLDALLEEKDRTRVTAACGLSLAELAKPLGETADPDRQAALAREKFALPADAEPSVEQLREAAAPQKEAAARPFSRPALRKLIVELQQKAEITVDHLSQDRIVEGTGYDVEKARSYIAEFERFLRENRDRILALQILYGRRQSRRRLTYTLIRDLAAAMESDAAHLAPAEVWKCYARLQPARARALDPGTALTNLISLVRFATGQQQDLTPFPELARARFQTWIGQQEQAKGAAFAPEQRAFLQHLAEEIGANGAIEKRADIEGVVPGGVARAVSLFGAEPLEKLLAGLNDSLAA